jgi:hypothetical protein
MHIPIWLDMLYLDSAHVALSKIHNFRPYVVGERFLFKLEYRKYSRFNYDLTQYNFYTHTTISSICIQKHDS